MVTKKTIIIGKKNINYLCIYKFIREFFIMYRKMIFIFFTIITTISNDKKTVFLLVISATSLFITVMNRPFLLRELNILEAHSNATALITIFAGSLYILDITDGLKAILFVLIILINSFFIVRWIFSVFDILMLTYETKILKFCPFILNTYYLLRKSIDDTPFTYNVPKYVYAFTRNYFLYNKNLVLIKI